jgi:hypothetical protein
MHNQRDKRVKASYSGAFTTDATSQLHVLGHDSDTLGVDGAEVGVLEESDHVSFSGLLESEDGGGLETEILLEFSGDFTDESLERKLADEELGALLEATDLTESDSAGSKAMGLLDTTGSGSGFLLGLLGSNVLAGSFTTGVLAGCVLGTGHFVITF